jgi:hypothetical protein
MSTIAPKGEQQRQPAQLEELARLGLVVGQVDPGDQGLHAAGGAPQGGQDADHGGQPQRAAGAAGDLLELLPDELGGLRRQHLGQPGDLVADRFGVGDQPVDGDPGDDGREQRQQGVEGHPGRQQRHLVGLDLLGGPLGDVLPALRRDLLRLLGLPPPTRVGHLAGVGGVLGRRAGAGRGTRRGAAGSSVTDGGVRRAVAAPAAVCRRAAPLPPPPAVRLATAAVAASTPSRAAHLAVPRTTPGRFLVVRTVRFAIKVLLGPTPHRRAR